MRDRLFDLLRSPGSADRLERFALTRDAAGATIDGLLVDRARNTAYPVIGGVPVLLPDAFPLGFLETYRDAIARESSLAGVRMGTGADETWSFSREWTAHFDADADRTWGYTARERFEQLLMEAAITPAWLAGKVVLDAGCGNGALSMLVAEAGAEVIGLDYSSGVRGAEQRRRLDSAHFVQADLQRPPLAPGSIDLVFSIGVLHHTPSTEQSFRAVAKLVRPGGRFYLWLYRRPERFAGRLLKAPLQDALRQVICRAPGAIQDHLVRAYASLVKLTHRVRGRRDIPFHEYVVSAYDDLTPRWRYTHTPFEVSRWFHEEGFGAPTLTHWDNPYGFGLVAEKTPQACTPGMHYGSGPKLWDDSTTLLGRLDGG